MQEVPRISFVMPKKVRQKNLLSRRKPAYFIRWKKKIRIKSFPVIGCQICPDMKKITLDNIGRVLERLEFEPEILLDAQMAERAKVPLEQMLVLAKQ